MLVTLDEILLCSSSVQLDTVVLSTSVTWAKQSQAFLRTQVSAFTNTEMCGVNPYEPRREKTGFLHVRKQRRRSASR